MQFPNDPVMTVERVSKLYARREYAMRKRLARFAQRAAFGRSAPEVDTPVEHEFWALNDVSFNLRRGEALGVIGLNGSGKTTLLRILAGQILPDRGEVRIAGTTASMIDLQAGFQPSLSGHANIFLRAAALGFSRRDTKAMIPEIVAFSELGDAIDAPMATYSAGMKMRLAFSVMAMVQPDVLLIDEVLAVGDFRFRQKCLARIREMRVRSAFVFVSHSMSDVERFCDRAIVLNKGQIIFLGQPKEAIEIYEALGANAPVVASSATIARVMGSTFQNENAITDVEHYWSDENGTRIDSVEFGKSFQLVVKFHSSINSRTLNIGVPIWNSNATYTTGLSTEITMDRFDVKAGESVAVALEVQGGFLNPGTIKSMLSIVDGPEFFYRRPNPDLVITKAAHPTWGAITLPHKWKRLEAPQTPPEQSGAEGTQQRQGFNDA